MPLKMTTAIAASILGALLSSIQLTWFSPAYAAFAGRAVSQCERWQVSPHDTKPAADASDGVEAGPAWGEIIPTLFPRRACSRSGRFLNCNASRATLATQVNTSQRSVTWITARAVVPTESSATLFASLYSLTISLPSRDSTTS
jgi:hypothetical protein